MKLKMTDYRKKQIFKEYFLYQTPLDLAKSLHYIVIKLKMVESWNIKKGLIELKNSVNTGQKMAGQQTWLVKFYLMSIQSSVIIEMTSHFFPWETGKELVRDTLKVLEIVQTTFKRMPLL